MYPENDYRNYLEHSAKGTHWKKGHKYIAIKNGKHIYPEDLKSGQNGAYGGQSRKFGSSTNVIRGLYSKDDIQPEHLKSKPGMTSGTDTAKGSDIKNRPNRPRGHERKFSFEKQSNAKKWKVKKATVKKGKKGLNLKTKVGNVLNRPFK